MAVKALLSPTFRRPRRPSSVVRVLGMALLIVICFYYLDGSRRQQASPKIYKFVPRPSRGTSPASRGGSGKSAQTGEHEDKRPPSPGQKVLGPDEKPLPGDGSSSSSSTGEGGSRREHPIDKLMRDADAKFADMMSRQSNSLEEAAARYRERRGRHPPPGFEMWYHFAWANQAVVVEDFWDQIYEDLEPFWGVDPRYIRKEAWDFEMVINVRNHSASTTSDWFWTQIWLDMLSYIQHLLPDMDIPLNAMDEPRIVTPWEEINRYMTEAAKTRRFFDPRRVDKYYGSLPEPGRGLDRPAMMKAKNWERSGSYWDIIRRGCHPESAARKTPPQKSFDHAPEIHAENALAHSYRGFVANETLAKSPCHQPDLQGLHGIFIEPLSIASTKTFFPLFGGSKLSVNNEILLPAPMYWGRDQRFAADESPAVEFPWAKKETMVFWRGVATGGRALEKNWRGFQRHRFVAINNGTQLAAAENEAEAKAAGKPRGGGGSKRMMGGAMDKRRHTSAAKAPADWAGNFELPDRSYGLAAQAAGRLGAWTDEWSSVAFTDLNCQPQEPDNQCHYTTPYFETSLGVPLEDMFGAKYLPDVDGNSFSGRYLAFLRSTSLPIKATMFREWHDSRLVAWKHFVPMDMRLGDWHAIMEYFLGYEDPRPNGRRAARHDAQAEKLATAGREWAQRVLRREDMLVYVLRLLLEYARVSDERRETMGFVDDLVANQQTNTG